MSPSDSIRVMIVDDHAMVRGGLRLFLSTQEDMEVVAEAGDGQEAVALCARAQPDVILMDLVMPVLDGATATARIRQLYPHIQVIALTSFLEKDLVHGALQAGAISYVLKDVDAGRLADAIRAARRGQTTLSPPVTQVLVEQASAPPAPDYGLTEREREVLALLVAWRLAGHHGLRRHLGRGSAGGARGAGPRQLPAHTGALHFPAGVVGSAIVAAGDAGHDR